jgi:DNA-binding transcriptional MerR regulator/cyclopropane fatty-acyl-phospholipid synthase-like methyltransferase
MEKKYYTTGQFAKMANVSNRTIRYYDKQGLLKPHHISEKGYRYYSDDDFVKLQQILSLKNLGFSLEEIFSMTLRSDVSSLKESFSLQKKMIHKKIQHYEAILSSIEEVDEYLNEHDHLEWNKLVHLISLSQAGDDIVEQYRNASNVEIRIRLHEKYSTSKVSWFTWLFDQYDIMHHKNILELGCGNGQLWIENKDKIPLTSNILLTDVSKGMLEDARSNLFTIGNIDYKKMNCEHLLLEDESVDLIIANHMLFYVEDVNQALKEIKRVLSKGGLFVCSTYGSHHMKEITDLVKSFNQKINLSKNKLYEKFGLENGKEILSQYFDDVEMHRHEDSLEVTDSDDLTNYILSCHGNQLEYISKDYESFLRMIHNKMKQTGKMHITKEAGCFICRKSFD